MTTADCCCRGNGLRLRRSTNEGDVKDDADADDADEGWCQT